MNGYESLTGKPQARDLVKVFRLPIHILRASSRLLLAGSLTLAVLVFVVIIVPGLFGFKYMVVTSGSMTPSIHTGDAVLVRGVDPASIEVGNVVTFPMRNGEGLNTHRVISMKEINGRTYLQTQGDANPVPDPDLTPVGAVQGKVGLRVPKGGYLALLLSVWWCRMFIIALPLVVLAIQEIKSLPESESPASRELARQLKNSRPNAEPWKTPRR
jgi:signal peptidase